jgi:4-hydroxy-tetrahydrodipicolinate reductase
VNLFFQLNEYLAKLMAPHTDYKISVEEIHHTQKLDYPSGTAITLTEGILSNSPNYTTWNTALNETPLQEEKSIPIKAVREEHVPGTHIISYSNEIDQIKIEHIANNRLGFALGAVIAAEWIVDKKGIYTFRDTLK